MIEIVKASPVETEGEQQVLPMPNLDGTRMQPFNFSRHLKRFMTSEFITFASMYGTDLAPTQKRGTKWFRTCSELSRGNRATRVVPKVSEIQGAGAASLQLYIRTNQKHAYIGTNRFFHVPLESLRVSASFFRYGWRAFLRGCILVSSRFGIGSTCCSPSVSTGLALTISIIFVPQLKQ